MPSPELRQFDGTDRFELLQLLGRGGMGEVYEARDRLRGGRVALKVLPHATPERLLRFKREFRAVAELRHENLVRLGDLVGSGEHWFFTMERVVGTDIATYVRGPHDSSRTGASEIGAYHDTLAQGLSAPQAQWASPLELGVEERLRCTLLQLARALCALHRANTVHRDVKPSNVLVTDSGRLVLLDFGLAGLTDEQATQWGAGTPLYMAPEQALGAVLPAADWYAFGVLMFELLTGNLPFRGAPEIVLLTKQSASAPLVHSQNPALPLDLAQLCDALLATDPGRRPNGDDVLAVLEDRPPRQPRQVPTQTTKRSPIYGRESEWEQLSHAFDETCRVQRPRAVSVLGESGIGKSAVVRAFSESLSSARRALVFSGRCHQRELVPYKAMDGIFDTLAKWLLRRSDTDLQRLLPKSAGVLARTFPVFGAVPHFASPPGTVDPVALRRTLFTSTCELLTNLAREDPLVLVIDDLHWADQDSLSLIAEIMATEVSARILLLFTTRTSAGVDPVEWSTLRSLGLRHIALGPLSRVSSAELAQRLLADAEIAGVDARQVALESEGHPLFLRELVHHVASAFVRPAGVSLEGMLRKRVESASLAASQVLHCLAVAGAPLATTLLAEAVSLPPDVLADARHELLANGMLQAMGDSACEVLDVSHDRVRQVVIRMLEVSDARQLHAQLANSFERRDDSAASALHWRAAGKAERAARHYARAGAAAAEALAFSDASNHFAMALEIGTWSEEERRDTRINLAKALSNAGQGAAAAAVFRAAAEGADRWLAIDLKRCAAEELMMSGYTSEGAVVAHEVLCDAGMSLPRFPVITLLALRLWLRIRGLGARRPPRTPPDTQLLARIDLCWSLTNGHMFSEPVQGACMQARCLALTLRARDPHRLARSLAGEGAYCSGFSGTRGQARARALLERAQSMAQQLDKPEVSGTVAMMAGISAHLGGRFGEARLNLECAISLFRERCSGVAHELDVCRHFWLECTYYLGDLPRFTDSVTLALKEAQDRGSIRVQSNTRTGLANAAWLMRGEPELAEQECEQHTHQGSTVELTLHFWYRLFARTQCDLYRGRGLDAERRIETSWEQLKRSHMLRLQHTRIAAVHLRARSLLAASIDVTGVARTFRLGRARRMARVLEREKEPWAGALSALIATGADAIEGQDLTALRARFLLGALERSEMNLYRAALLTLQPAHLSSQGSTLEQLGVREPRSFARMLLPGLDRGLRMM